MVELATNWWLCSVEFCKTWLYALSYTSVWFPLRLYLRLILKHASVLSSLAPPSYAELLRPGARDVITGQGLSEAAER